MRGKIVVAVLCASVVALAAMSLPAGASTSGSSAALAAPGGDWCPVGVYMSTTRRCCLDPDACSSQIQALPRPHILDPRATLYTSLSGPEQSETSPADPDATGSITVTTRPDISQVCFTITMSGMDRQAVMGHIHNAPRGQSNAVPVVELFENVNAPGTISQCRFADPVTIRDMRLNPRAYYAQVHNTQYAQGAMRGQFGD
jgi:CHRD domain